MIRSLFRWLFVPALLAGSVASWMYREEIKRILVAHSYRMDTVSAAFLATIALIWIAEQVFPANRDWNYRLLSNGLRGWGKLGQDLFYLFVVTQVTSALISATESRTRGAIGGLRVASVWPSTAPVAARILLAFLIVEFLSYWMHRAAHRFPILWRFHGTHHVVTELSGIKSLRVHPVDNVYFYVARYAPLMLLGAGAEDMLAATYFGSLLGILSHANIDVSEKGLGLVVNFPRYHAVHHSANVTESNSNFGCHTVVWDRLFGTFRAQPATPLELGAEPVGPRSLWHELVRPFYRSAP